MRAHPVRVHPAKENFFLVDVPGGRFNDQEPSEFTRPDALDQETLNKDRVRQLLRRYGILFRDLLERELPASRWPVLFRPLRIMELGGEVVSGYFFEGIGSVQFCPASLLGLLREWEPSEEVFWMNAADPASLCGTGIEGLGYRLPPRIGSIHLVYHGTKLVLVSRSRGKRIDILVPKDSPHIARYLGLFRTMTERDFEPPGSVRVEQINGVPVRKSPYFDAFVSFGFRALPSGIVHHRYQR